MSIPRDRAAFRKSASDSSSSVRVSDRACRGSGRGRCRTVGSKVPGKMSLRQVGVREHRPLLHMRRQARGADVGDGGTGRTGEERQFQLRCQDVRFARPSAVHGAVHADEPLPDQLCHQRAWEPPDRAGFEHPGRASTSVSDCVGREAAAIRGSTTCLTLEGRLPHPRRIVISVAMRRGPCPRPGGPFPQSRHPLPPGPSIPTEPRRPPRLPSGSIRRLFTSW